jgi:tripartite-type tricarboxylate transporter receptor subunit TctC
MKGYAVTTAARIPQLPNTPTLREAGLAGYEWIEWGGVFAPAGTPAPILDRMNAALRQALALPATQDRLRQIGMVAVGSSRADFATYVREQRTLLERLTREANVTLD